jgi:hypothetical protein
MNPHEALKLVKKLAKGADYYYDSHAESRMSARRISNSDVENILLSPACRVDGVPEEQNGSWRYRLTTNSGLVVVVGFHADGKSMVIITVFQKESKRPGR